jgi:hypothetical protein
MVKNKEHLICLSIELLLLLLKQYFSLKYLFNIIQFISKVIKIQWSKVVCITGVCRQISPPLFHWSPLTSCHLHIWINLKSLHIPVEINLMITSLYTAEMVPIQHTSLPTILESFFPFSKNTDHKVVELFAVSYHTSLKIPNG